MLLGSVVVENFEEPEVDMQLKLDLEFLTRFLNLEGLKAGGNAELNEIS